MARLGPVTPHGVVVGMALRQPHLFPGLHRWTGYAVSALEVVLVGSGIIEEVELDQLDALVLEVQERAVDPPAGRTEVPVLIVGTGGLAAGVTGCPVVRPVHPWLAAQGYCPVAATALGGVILDLPEKPLRALLRNRAESPFGEREAGFQVRLCGGAPGESEDEGGSYEQATHSAVHVGTSYIESAGIACRRLRFLQAEEGAAAARKAACRLASSSTSGFANGTEGHSNRIHRLLFITGLSNGQAEKPWGNLPWPPPPGR